MNRGVAKDNNIGAGRTGIFTVLIKIKTTVKISISKIIGLGGSARHEK